jgi:hypothetical protein
MYWYQFLILTDGAGINFSRTYSEEQKKALVRWTVVLAQSNPSIHGKIRTNSEEVSLSESQQQRTILKEFQSHVPHVRDDESINARLETLRRTLIFDMTGEQSEGDGKASAPCSTVCFVGKTTKSHQM